MKSLHLKYVFPFMVLMSTLDSSALAFDGPCGSLTNHFGPFDYRTATTENLNMVERTHFTSKVESLRGGNTTMTPGGDMGYTLGVFPNHHRALMALIRYEEKSRKDPPPEMRYTVRCYFERAEQFRPDDGMVQALYGVYLTRSGKTENGIQKLEHAIDLAGDNANLYYNLGLAYFDIKQYDKALANAHKAYNLGFELPGLKAKLKKIGRWSDPPVRHEQTEPTEENQKK